MAYIRALKGKTGTLRCRVRGMWICFGLYRLFTSFPAGFISDVIKNRFLSEIDQFLYILARNQKIIIDFRTKPNDSYRILFEIDGFLIEF